MKQWDFWVTRQTCRVQLELCKQKGENFSKENLFKWRKGQMFCLLVVVTLFIQNPILHVDKNRVFADLPVYYIYIYIYSYFKIIFNYYNYFLCLTGLCQAVRKLYPKTSSTPHTTCNFKNCALIDCAKSCCQSVQPFKHV